MVSRVVGDIDIQAKVVDIHIWQRGRLEEINPEIYVHMYTIRQSIIQFYRQRSSVLNSVRQKRGKNTYR